MAKILLVSSDTKLIPSWQDALLLGGHTVDVAISGPEAFNRASSGKPQLVIINENEQSKNTIIKNIQSNESTASLPVMTMDFSSITRVDMILSKIAEKMSPKKILIAEDDRHMSNILKLLLEAKGYNVVAVYDGAEALNKIKVWNPQLVVLDIMLPVIDGFHLCQMVNDDLSIEKKPRVLIISGRESDWDKNLGAACGAEHYLVKPFDNAFFIKKVQEILQ